MGSGSTEQDGRRARGARTRESIITEFTATVRGGEVPSFELLAQNMGISVRSIYVHFPRTRDLYVVSAQRAVLKSRTATRDLQPVGSLLLRIGRFVTIRARALPEVVPFYRFQNSFGLTLSLSIRAEIERIFVNELESMPSPHRFRASRAADAIVSPGAWLHVVEGGSAVREFRGMCEFALHALLGDTASPTV